MTLPGFTPCETCEGTGTLWCPRTYSDGPGAPCCCGTTTGGHVACVCPVCGGAGQVPDDDTVEAAARALFDMTKPMQPGSQVPPFGSFLTDNVYRHQARAALLAYARHTQETKP